jgi:hypothetical protein
MHGSRSKIPSKNLVKQRCREGFISGVTGLNKCAIGVRVEKIVRIENAGILLTLFTFVQFVLWDLGKIRENRVEPRLRKN